jgi:predicted transcriptional regulator
MTNSYHNTTKLSGKELGTAIVNAKKMDDVILDLFKANTDKEFTSIDLWSLLPDTALLTSVRRSVNTLFEKELITRVGSKKEVFGAPNFTYKFRK